MSKDGTGRDAPPAPWQRGGWLRSRGFWALVALGLALGLLGDTPLGQAVSMEALASHRERLAALVAQQGALAVAGFVVIYVALVALALPGPTVMTLAGGMLFGALAGAVLSALSATAGAALVFLLARRLVGAEGLDALGQAGARIAAGIRRDEVAYLLSLRLVPLFPFMLVTLAAAFCGIRLRVFAATTLAGILPVTGIFALAGSGLGEVLDAGRAFEMGDVLTPPILGALAGLALIALATVPLRRRLRRHAGR